MGCGLSCQSVALLSNAVASHCSHSLRFFCIEMNPLSNVVQEKSDHDGDEHDGEEVHGEQEDVIHDRRGISVASDPNEYVDTIQARLLEAEFAEQDGEKRPVQDIVTFEHAIRSFMQCKVTHLSLRSCNIGDTGAAVVASVLKTDSYIVSLNLFGNCIGDEGVRHIAEALRTNRRLQSLDLGLNSGMTNVAVEYIAGSFQEKELDTLESFVQVRNSVYMSHYGPELVPSADSIPAHAFAGQDSKSARNRAKSKKDPQTVEPLAAWDSQCRMVGEAPVPTPGRRAGKKESSKGADPGAEHNPIAYIVPGNTTLRHIGLSCNSNLTNDSVRSFLREGSNLSGLERVNFSRTQISSDALSELASARMKHASQQG